MAFNFNWSPLMADADFYKRAQEMLTIALNKSPKPPIIVDDIIVNELNLGSVSPELEILEIGDLAEDRFRGIFKMCYSGDAFLTLRTKVQANPMNTYLSSKSSFASPKPLAAASGLMIPLKITLSHIKLSAFIILVFSRQKGLTLVFRNDPLESLKVSSTFDSIPFVRDYLQNEIELQLRTLMMDELPAIIHRLSLRLWCKDYVTKEHTENDTDVNQLQHLDEQKIAINPFSNLPQDAVDSRGNILDANEISSLSFGGGSSDIHLLFSQKNLLRLAALSDSHRTLSLFTPSIRDAVFRAWASPSDRSDTIGTTTPASPAFVRTHSSAGSTSTIYTFSRNSEDGQNCLSSCPSSVNSPSTTGLSLGSSRNARSHLRKKKNRVVNLRNPKIPKFDELLKESVDDEEASLTTTNVSNTMDTTSEPLPLNEIETEDNIIAPQSPHRVRFRNRNNEIPETPRQSRFPTQDSCSSPTKQISEKVALGVHSTNNRHEPAILDRCILGHLPIAMSDLAQYQGSRFTGRSEKICTPGSILEQAWVLKMASELVRRAAHEEKSQDNTWPQVVREDAPPAYEAKV